MSHIQHVKCELRDLQAVEKACQRLGWKLVLGQSRYRWFGRWMGDSPIPEHLFSAGELQTLQEMTREKRSAFLTNYLGNCDHAIRIPGATYEIGLLKINGVYQPVWDNWRTGGLAGLSSENGMGGFLQAYALEAAKAEALRNGHTYQEEVLQDGTIKARIVAAY